MPPRVSVVIPCYKQAHFLRDSVGSALGQLGEEVDGEGGIEVIVVDDGSPDGTGAVAGEFGDRVRYVRTENRGLAKARNTGLAMATGAWVVFLDADDMLGPGQVRGLLAALSRADEGVVGAGCGWTAMDGDGALGEVNPGPGFGETADDAFHALFPLNLVPPVCYLFRTAAVREAGGFGEDPRLYGHEDWELLLRLTSKGGRLKGVEGVTAWYRVMAGSMSTKRARMSASALYTISLYKSHHRGCEACRRRIGESLAIFRLGWLRSAVIVPWRGAGGVRERTKVLRKFGGRLAGDPGMAGWLVGERWRWRKRRGGGMEPRGDSRYGA